MARLLSWNGWLGVASAVVAILLVFAASPANAQQKAPPGIEDIQKAWQARQDRVRTARITWKEECTWPKGSISLSHPPDAVTRIPEIKDKIMPPADTTVETSYVVTMDNDKVRYEYEGKEWSNARQDFRPVKYLSVFNGKTAKDVYPIGLGGVDWSQGAIHKSSAFQDGGFASLLPLMLAYRAFVPSLKPIDDLRGMTLVARQEVVDGRPCIELVQRLSPASSIHIWVDPARDFVLTRRLCINQDKPVDQVDLFYRRDEDIGWVPTNWKTVNHHVNGNLLYSFNAEVASAEFNIGVAPDTFDFEFPPLTYVVNEKTREWYIVRRDGTKRPVVGEELSKSYEELVNSDPAQALLLKRFTKSHWPSAIAVAVGLLALGIFIWRRLRLRESPRKGVG